MIDTNQNSFIPKRGPTKQIKRAVTKNVYIITILSYVALFVVLVASGGIFIYQQVVQNRFTETIVAFNTATQSFNEADLQRVAQLESRLRQTKYIVNRQYSMAEILEKIEKSVIGTSRLVSLQITPYEAPSARQSRSADPAVVAQDGLFLFTFDIGSDSYDSVIFQRDTFIDTDDVLSVAVTDLQQTFTSSVTPNTSVSSVSEAEADLVRYKLSMQMDVRSLPANPAVAAQKSGTTPQRVTASDDIEPVFDDNQE